MQTTTTKSEPITQAVFSVCIAPEVSVSVTEAVSAVPGAEFIGEFQEYITAERRPQFPDAMKEAVGCVALIDCDHNTELALETMERLRQAFPNRLHLIAISQKMDADFLLRAMRSGCDDFLTRPIEQELLRAALSRFQRGRMEAQTIRGQGKVLAVCGVKGGVGATTLAVHLASHLVRRHRQKVLLIDHKPELGHVALHLGMKESVYHFDELVRNANRLDAELLNGFVMRHSSGLEVIPSPDARGLAQAARGDAIARVVDYLRTCYDFVVFDSSLQFDAPVRDLIGVSDEVCVVSTPDVAALRDLVRHVEHLSVLAGFSSKLRVIVNRYNSDDALNAEDVEAAVRYPIAVTIPNNYAELMRALNAGEPVPPQQRCGFTQAIAQWANRLAPAPQSSKDPPAAEPKRRFLFGLGFSRP